MAKLSSFVQKDRAKAAIFTTPLSKTLYGKSYHERLSYSAKLAAHFRR
jgi:hypothetical protein